MINAKDANVKYSEFLESKIKTELAELKKDIEYGILEAMNNSPYLRFTCDEKYHQALALWLRTFDYKVTSIKKELGDSREMMSYDIPAYLEIKWS